MSLEAKVLDSVEDAVIAIDCDGTITIFNPSAQNLLGISDRQALGQCIRAIFVGQDELLQLIFSSLGGGRTISRHEELFLVRGGRRVPVNISVSPLFSITGVQEGAVVILRDMTRVRELEDTVKRSERLSMLGSIAAGLAHEIKNPLGGIRGAAQLMAMELEEFAPAREYLDVMLREVDRVKHTIEELMDLANPRQPQMGEVNLARILREIILLEKGAPHRSGVEFVLALDPSIPPVDGDEVLLTRLFRNLILNGAEAMPEGGTLRVETRISSEYHFLSGGKRPTPMVNITVSDTGIGMTEEQREQIFTPFFTTKNAGTGLGLAISQKIIAEHSGLVKIESEPGRGTTFVVSLPLHQRGTTTVPGKS